jgi:transposase
MSKKARKRFTAPEKVTILRLHLLEHVPVSDLCDQHGIHPTMFYRWQKEFFENGSVALEPRSRRAGDAKDRQIALLENAFYGSGDDGAMCCFLSCARSNGDSCRGFFLGRDDCAATRR